MIVKLHTTTSTNSFLKEWLTEHSPENFMVVMADEQTEARGQMGTKWIAKKGKNLTFSMFVGIENLEVSRQFELNQAVSLGLFTAIKKYIVNLTIKWPNDILSDTKKIAGILIENSVSNKYIKQSIIGIGLNVNQTEFPEEIPNASSLKILLNKTLDIDVLLLEIIDSIKKQFVLLENNKGNTLERNYIKNLYLFNQITTFRDKENNQFVGKIIGLTTNGRLQIKMLNAEILEFDYKEVRFLN